MESNFYSDKENEGDFPQAFEDYLAARLDGNLQGLNFSEEEFEYVLDRLVAEELGVDIEFVVIDWDMKINEVNAKNIDCVWNGMTLTAEVTAAMDCSAAYCNNAQVVVVAK